MASGAPLAPLDAAMCELAPKVTAREPDAELVAEAAASLIR
tara:strand:- start:113 stop:235 length:123 start_codon:yes stop_codon:yes gene_type:complete